MRKKVYIETSVISYLAGRPTSDKKIAEEQTLTHRWCKAESLPSGGAMVSRLAAGHCKAESLRHNSTVYGAYNYFKAESLAQDNPAMMCKAYSLDLFLHRIHRALPCAVMSKGFALQNDIAYLLTWNCTHLANAKVFDKVKNVLNQLGYWCPEMLTPEGLMKKEVENE